MAAEDEEMAAELGAQLGSVERRLAELEEARLFSGEYDAGDAVVTVHAGAGGTDSQDWAEILLRMYLRWSERRGFEVEMKEASPGEEAGLKSATFIARGENAYGLFAAERGVHRLVRISPFDSSARRHTSFAQVDVGPLVDAGVEVEIDEADLRIDTYRASGAGGQHVNKTDSAVRITHLPTGVVVQCQNERSQTQNKAVAMQFLRSKLIELEERKRAEEMARARGEVKDVAWGSQIRSYVLHPYTMVKDHRTEHEVGDVQRVLDGDIDEFVRDYLNKTAASSAQLDGAAGATSSARPPRRARGPAGPPPRPRHRRARPAAAWPTRSTPARRLRVVTPRAPLSLPGSPGYHWYLVPRVGYPDPETFFAARAALAELHDRLWEETGVGPERTVLGGFSMGCGDELRDGARRRPPARSPGSSPSAASCRRSRAGSRRCADRAATRAFIAHGRRDPSASRSEFGAAERPPARDLLEAGGLDGRLPRVRDRPPDRSLAPGRRDRLAGRDARPAETGPLGLARGAEARFGSDQVSRRRRHDGPSGGGRRRRGSSWGRRRDASWTVKFLAASDLGHLRPRSESRSGGRTPLPGEVRLARRPGRAGPCCRAGSRRRRRGRGGGRVADLRRTLSVGGVAETVASALLSRHSAGASTAGGVFFAFFRFVFASSHSSPSNSSSLRRRFRFFFFFVFGGRDGRRRAAGGAGMPGGRVSAWADLARPRIAIRRQGGEEGRPPGEPGGVRLLVGG